MVIHYRLLLFCVNTALFLSFLVQNFTIINFYTCQTSDDQRSICAIIICKLANLCV